MFEIYPEITKEYILDRVSEEELFTFYLGNEVSFKALFRSPLRNDKTPTCNIYKGKDGLLRLKDFAGGPSGSIFNLVMLQYGLTYQETLKKIAKDYKLFDNANANSNNPILVNRSSNERGNTEDQKIIRIKAQDWTSTDKEYWGSYHISEEQLFKYSVVSCSHCWWIDSTTGELELKAIYHYRNPIYCYNFGNLRRKIYWPMQKEFRFRGNTNILQGLQQLRKSGDLLVWTKSQKDVMALDSMGYNAVAAHGENHHLDEAVVDDLKNRFTKHIICYDPDPSGIIGRNKLVDKYGWDWFEMPEGKDVSGYCKLNGIDKTKKLLNDLIK